MDKIKISKDVLIAIIAQNVDCPIEEVNEETTIPQDSDFSHTRVCIEIGLESVLEMNNLVISNTIKTVGQLIAFLKELGHYEC